MATIIVHPSAIQLNRSANQTLALSLASAGWIQGTTVFTLSGVAGVTKITSIVEAGGASARVVVTTSTTAGTLTISDGTNTGTTHVKKIRRRRWFPGLAFGRQGP